MALMRSEVCRSSVRATASFSGSLASLRMVSLAAFCAWRSASTSTVPGLAPLLGELGDRLEIELAAAAREARADLVEVVHDILEIEHFWHLSRSFPAG